MFGRTQIFFFFLYFCFVGRVGFKRFSVEEYTYPVVVVSFSIYFDFFSCFRCLKRFSLEENTCPVLDVFLCVWIFLVFPDVCCDQNASSWRNIRVRWYLFSFVFCFVIDVSYPCVLKTFLLRGIR